MIGGIYKAPAVGVVLVVLGAVLAALWAAHAVNLGVTPQDDDDWGDL